jgi:peroxiredoxin
MLFSRLISVLILLILPLLSVSAPPRTASLKVTTMDGRKLTLDQMRGKVVLVMFFSTDCPHCQRTTQVLRPLYEELRPQGLEIVGIAINPAASGNLQSFARKYGAEFPLSLGTRGDCTRFAGISVMARFYVPYLFFVDKNGIIRQRHDGSDRVFYRNEAQNIRNAIQTLLKESR